MTAEDWHNCENCEVVPYLPCSLYYCNKSLFILAVKQGNVSKSSASKDFKLIVDYSLPGSKKKKENLIYTFNHIKLR